MSCRGSLVAMVTARCWTRSHQHQHATEGSQSTNRNPLKPGLGRSDQRWRELSPGDSSIERQGNPPARISAGKRALCSIAPC
ncbi:TPA: hypothetical protein SMP48_000354 [Proteus mirabilis]|nr:hypothetical protein [Proteus mirabilis]